MKIDVKTRKRISKVILLTFSIIVILVGLFGDLIYFASDSMTVSASSLNVTKSSSNNSSNGQKALQNNLVVDTCYGKVQGKSSQDGIMSFLGIPYAAAPVGDLRFMPPQAHVAWNVTRNSTQYGATAPQLSTAEPLGDLYPNTLISGDDYLNLNIWTNNLENKKPVMVFVHGGSFTSGSGSVEGYDGSNFAKNDVVLVTINYRLGVDGFLWFGEGDANLGLLDQIAGLKWIQTNITNFGGDPSRITVFGESAGAMSIGTLLAMPSADGLFQQAIMESGAADHAISSDSAKLVAGRVADILGVEHTRKAITKVSEESLLKAQKQVGEEISKKPDKKLWGDVANLGMAFLPVVDGKSLPDYPMNLIKEGASSNVNLLIGNNSQESFLLFAPKKNMDQYTKWEFYLYACLLKIPAFDAYKVYFDARPDARPVDVIGDLVTDKIYRIPSVQLAETIPNSYMYEFDWHSPAFDNKLGAAHGVELPFVFNNINGKDWNFMTEGKAPQSLAIEVQTSWVDFAKNRNPGWDKYTKEDRTVKLLSTDSKVLNNPHAEATEFWEKYVLNNDNLTTNPNKSLIAVVVGIIIMIVAIVVGIIFLIVKQIKKWKRKISRNND